MFWEAYMNYTLYTYEKWKAQLDTGTSIFLQDIISDSVPDGLSIHVIFEDCDQLSVSKQGFRVEIRCKEPAHYFRALNRVLHHLEDDTFSFSENVIFPKNGFMLDCSRNAVFTVEKVKSMIRLLARLGMNVLMLYTEDTYEVDHEPYFGAYRGRYSHDEIRQMDDYAQAFGIELVPCIQTLAHLRNALRWPMGDPIADTTDNLFVGKDEVYLWLENVLRSVKSSFSTRRIHLGMDEAVQLGLGKYLREKGYTKSSELMKEHCSRVLAICRKLELEPMIWSDMYITSNTGQSYYAPHSLEDTSSWVKPEKDIQLVYWDYYNGNESVYDNMLQVHEALSEQIIFAGGAWTWNGISPNYSRAFHCTLEALKACRKHNINEIICTAWLDNGSETPIDTVYPPLVLFGHMGFHEEPDRKLLMEEFYQTTGGHLEDFYQLDKLDALFITPAINMTSDNPSKYLLYQDTMLGMFDYHVQNIDAFTYYHNLAKQLCLCAQHSPAYEKLFTFYQYLAEILSEKAGLGVRIKSAYDTGDLSTLEKICEEVIPRLTEKMWKLKWIREELWLQDAKAFGYELLDIKLGGVITRLESHRRRIQSYLDGKVRKLEELEQERLPYFADEHHHSENRWDKIISGCSLFDTI